MAVDRSAKVREDRDPGKSIVGTLEDTVVIGGEHTGGRGMMKFIEGVSRLVTYLALPDLATLNLKKQISPS
jgi:hypothetical protein